MGRPRKYEAILKVLEDGKLYSPAGVARFAEENGLLEGANEKARTQSRQRVRISMGRWANRNEFPDEGDGLLTIPGQAPTPGWFGWRWKGSLD